MLRCERDGCEQAAQFAVEICVPAKTMQAKEREWPSVIIGLKLCLTHAKEFDAKQQFNDPRTADTWKTIFKVAYGVGKYKELGPDFDRAFVNPIPLDGEKFLTYERMTAKGKQQ